MDRQGTDFQIPKTSDSWAREYLCLTNLYLSFGWKSVSIFSSLSFSFFHSSGWWNRDWKEHWPTAGKKEEREEENKRKRKEKGKRNTKLIIFYFNFIFFLSFSFPSHGWTLRWTYLWPTVGVSDSVQIIYLHLLPRQISEGNLGRRKKMK